MLVKANNNRWNEEQQQDNQIQEALRQYGAEAACGRNVDFLAQKISTVKIAQFGRNYHIGEERNIDNLYNFPELWQMDTILRSIANVFQQQFPTYSPDTK